MEGGRVESARTLQLQAARYAAEADAGVVPATAYLLYIDTALLVQRGASGLFDAWAGEMFLNLTYNSDRDQPPFAYVLARGWHRGLAYTEQAFNFCVDSMSQKSRLITVRNGTLLEGGVCTHRYSFKHREPVTSDASPLIGDEKYRQPTFRRNH